VVIGAVGLFVAAGTEPGRLWQALLFNWLFWSSVAIGMLMFAVALHLTNADWAWSVRRFALGGGAFLPISFVLFLVVLFGGKEYFFVHWLHVEGDHVIDAKSAWLNFPGLAARDIILILVLYAMALRFMYNAIRPDVYGVSGKHRSLYERLTGNFRGVAEEAHRGLRENYYLGVALAFVFTIVWGIVGIDMAMSLQPHFFSTMFPVAFFWTAFHGGVAATAIAVALLRSPTRLDDFITRRQSHDLGKLIFAFSVFWMYLNWAQYIVIWYGLFPHEQEYFVARFLAPFGGIVLLGHWLERYILVYPALFEGGPESGLPLGIPEIALGLGFLGLFAGSYIWFVSRFPLLPSPASLKARGPGVIPAPAPTAAEV
jgi:magnesium-transporting ATPase (P-type)